MAKNITKEASSNISMFEYDPTKKELIVEFKGGRQYKYFDVPQHIITAFQNSESFGSFHNKNIKGKYKEKKID